MSRRLEKHHQRALDAAREYEYCSRSLFLSRDRQDSASEIRNAYEDAIQARDHLRTLTKRERQLLDRLATLEDTDEEQALVEHVERRYAKLLWRDSQLPPLSVYLQRAS